jgi:MraZ protein
MTVEHDLILGEYQRTLDDRFRLSVPQEMVDRLLVGGDETCMLAKERPGCLSLWNREIWQRQVDPSVEVVRGKLRAGKLAGRWGDVQGLGRLLSTRAREAPLAGRGRLLIPEGFREFLAVEAGGEVMLIGAAVCVEIWKPAAWVAYLEKRMPQFRKLLDRLSE